MSGKQRTLYLPEQLFERLHQQAERIGISMSELIIFLLWEHFESAAQE
jgi:hypothetical protein